MMGIVNERNPIEASINLLGDSHKGAFLIVEGPTDARIFNKFIERKKCKVIIAHGKKNIHRLVKFKKIHRRKDVLIIRDADCIRIKRSIPECENILCTDTRDIETEILRSEILDILMNDFQITNPRCDMSMTIPLKTKDPLDPEMIIEGEFSLRDLLHLQCKFFGLLICYSQCNHWNLDFNETFKKIVQDEEDLKFLFDPMKYTLKSEKFLKTMILVVQNDPNIPRDEVSVIISKLKDYKPLFSELKKIEASCDNLWNVCRGHDLVMYLYFLLKHHYKIKNKNMHTIKDLEQRLYDLYDITTFQETELYHSIEAWEGRNVPYQILRKATN